MYWVLRDEEKDCMKALYCTEIWSLCKEDIRKIEALAMWICTRMKSISRWDRIDDKCRDLEENLRKISHHNFSHQISQLGARNIILHAFRI